MIKNMSLDQLIHIYRPAIEDTISKVVSRANGDGLDELHQMMNYHLGWAGEGAGPQATGKRIRPLLVLLTTQAAGGDWSKALPAAAAVELIHNFSLIHDDIEDNSPLRRGRPTLWAKWGIPLAINAGDSMFTLAHLAMLDLQENTTPSITLGAMNGVSRWLSMPGIPCLPWHIWPCWIYRKIPPPALPWEP
jgi:geranylgeranyl diphosphate synthase type I